MSSTLISVLHQEERSIVAELRASRQFQRLEGVRKLLALYDTQPSVATGIEGLDAERGMATAAVASAAVAAPAAPLRMVPPVMPMTHAASSQPIPMPGPTGGAEPVHAEPVRAHEANGTEASSVVSSVRAALLGIGKS